MSRTRHLSGSHGLVISVNIQQVQNSHYTNVLLKLWLLLSLVSIYVLICERNKKNTKKSSYKSQIDKDFSAAGALQLWTRLALNIDHR